jgi:hypothetical protein
MNDSILYVQMHQRDSNRKHKCVDVWDENIMEIYTFLKMNPEYLDTLFKRQCR